MQSAAKLCRESNAVYQISPKPIFIMGKYAEQEVGGRGGAYKLGTQLDLTGLNKI